jgi:aspartate-semialdehyde dehydrogenase
MKVAVVGATGLVGSELIKILDEGALTFSDLVLVASSRSAGISVSVMGESHKIVGIGDDWHEDRDVVFFVTEADISRIEIPRLRGKVPLIIDNSSAFRMLPDVPLVVPQVNPNAAFEHSGLIANPNCSTIQLVVAVNPIHRLSPVEKVIVSTYQAASGAGKEFTDRFWSETKDSAEATPQDLSRDQKSLAFNLLPSIDTLLSDGFSREEEKIMQETRKILSAEIKQVCATAVRVPVVNAHSEAVYVETSEELDLGDVKKALSDAPGVRFVSDHQNAATPREVSGIDDVFVSRLRKDRDRSTGMHMWVVADNLRKGAALNAVEIARLVTEEC